MNKKNINLSINNYELLAPLISASLVNAIYQRASLIHDDRPLVEKIISCQSEVLDLWSEISELIKHKSQEHFSK